MMTLSAAQVFDLVFLGVCSFAGWLNGVRFRTVELLLGIGIGIGLVLLSLFILTVTKPYTSFSRVDSWSLMGLEDLGFGGFILPFSYGVVLFFFSACVRKAARRMR